MLRWAWIVNFQKNDALQIKFLGKFTIIEMCHGFIWFGMLITVVRFHMLKIYVVSSGGGMISSW
jgi:hypothetical protein